MVYKGWRGAQSASLIASGKSLFCCQSLKNAIHSQRKYNLNERSFTMKAFIAAALLVATVAGQTLDTYRFQGKDLTTKFDRPLASDLLLKKLGYPLEKSLIYSDSMDLPLYVQDELLDKKVLTLEEIQMHPLFREYLQLPVFRQYWQYPIFQRYVSSVFFQRFWHIPAFKQYFVNPILFQKYVYPIVSLFKNEMITSDITKTSVLDELVNFGDLFKGQVAAEIVNKNVFPFQTADFEQDFQVGDVYTKNLVEKLYKHLINKPVVDDEILGKIFDPITGHVKTVDDELIPVEYLKTIYGEKLIKNVLLKKLIKYNIVTPQVYEAILLNKVDLFTILLKEKIITPEVYQLVLLGKVDKYTVYKHILNLDTLKTVKSEDLLKEVLLKKLVKINLITPDVYEAILTGKVDLFTVLLKEKIITPEMYQYLTLGKIDVFTLLHKILIDETSTVLPKYLVKDVLIKKLIKYNIITPEIYQAILLGKFDLLQVLLKKEIITPQVYQYILMGKIDKFEVFRHILKLDQLKTVGVEELFYPQTVYKFNPYMNMFNKNKFDMDYDTTTTTVFDMKKDLFNNVFDVKKDFVNTFDVKKDLINSEYEVFPSYKKDMINDKFMFNKDMTTTFVPKMVDIQTPMMGVTTFDKKMMPELIKKN